jgi:glutaminyl-tRNA synthetase
VEDPSNEEGDFKDYVNTDSLHVLPNVFIEPALVEANIEDRYQFLRKGYFCLDEESTPRKLVFNRTVSLKDTWAKEVKKKPQP